MSYIGNLPFGKTLRTVTTVTANGSATVFYPDGGYDVSFVDVFVSGVRLTSGLDYTATDGVSVTLLYTPTSGDVLDIVSYGLLELVSPVFPGSISVGSNVVINTSSISIGNSSVNTQIVAGNLSLNGSTLKVGNSSVNTVITGNSVVIGGTLTVTGNVSLTTNSVNSSMLTSTGVVANSYGNTTAIPVLTIDAAGRITNATTSSVSGVTGLSFAPANSTITVSTSTTNFDAAITSGNSTVQGLLKVIDSVSNTSTAIAGSANSVTTAYLLAANAVSNATAYAATAYSNAVATAASDATTKAGTAYSNATAYADTAAGTAYSNAASYANTIAYTAAGTAYSNAVSVAASDATTKAATAYSNATAYADTKAATAYSNAISYANTIAYTAAGTAYTNAASYADTKAATAYSNVFNGGTFSGAVVAQANLTANNVRVNGNLQIDGDLTVSGNTVTINVTNLNVEDNMIYLNSNSVVSHPDLGFAGNYNDGSYKHAGLFRDATDGVWKFFHGYTPEPDASVYIDTSNASFTYSNLQVNYVIGNVTGSANSATYLGGNTAATLRSYSDTMAGTAYSNATSYAATIAGTAYSNAVSVAASDATTKAGTAYSNATSYAATIAGTAYSNATSYAATIAGTAYSNATSYAATIAGTAYSNAVAYAASNSYVNSTFLKLTGGTVTGNVAVSAYVHANGTGGATGGYFGMVKIGYGAAYGTVERTDSDLYLQYNNAYNVVVGYGGGYLTATNSSRAPIFYDSDDTAYYTNPNSTSSMWNVNIRGDASSTNTSNQIFFWGNGSSTTSAIGFKANGGNFANPTGQGDGYNTYLTMDTDGRGWVFRRGTGGTDFTSAYTAGWILNNGIWQSQGSMRAPIFYDANDTAYFVNPNSRSRQASIDFGDGNYYISAGDWGMRNTTPYGWIQFGPANSTWCHIYGSHNIYFNQNTYVSGNWMLYEDTWQNGKHFSSGGVIYATSSMRAPIFYDYDNTGYYVNPNGGSNLSYLQIIGAWGGSPYGSAHEQFTIRTNYPSYTLRNTDTGYYWLVHHAADATINWYGGGGGVDGSAWNRNLYLDMSGNLTARANITAYSDIRLKTNIVTIDNAIDKVKRLRGVYFDWIESGEHSLGMIAQEVEEVLPELVMTNTEFKPFTKEVLNVTKSLDYSKVVSVLVEAIKEQQQEIEELKRLVNKLIGS